MAENEVTMEVVVNVRVHRHVAVLARTILAMASPGEHKKVVEGLLDSVMLLLNRNLVTDGDDSQDDDG